MRIHQAILLDASVFPTEEAAKAWLTPRGYASRIERKGAHWCAGQLPVERCESSTIETRRLSDPGVTAVVGELRGGVDPADELQTFSFDTGLIRAAADAAKGYAADFIASTEATDSYGDIVVQGGMNLDHFRANPVILFNHDPARPIGRATKISRDKAEGVLRARIEFATSEEGVLGQLGESVGKMVAAGYLSATSIGFMAVEREPIYDADGNWTGGLRFNQSILKEISVVAVPANHEALAESRALARSLGISEALVRSIVPNPPPAPSRRNIARRSIELRQRQLVMSGAEG